MILVALNIQGWKSARIDEDQILTAVEIFIVMNGCVRWAAIVDLKVIPKGIACFPSAGTPRRR